MKIIADVPSPLLRFQDELHNANVATVLSPTGFPEAAGPAGKDRQGRIILSLMPEDIEDARDYAVAVMAFGASSLAPMRR
jgi:hypothetical protein